MLREGACSTNPPVSPRIPRPPPFPSPSLCVQDELLDKKRLIVAKQDEIRQRIEQER
jgi:hypothetical protein